MVLRGSERALIRLGLLLLVLGLLGGAWELLAAQAPLTPLHMGLLPGPVEKLRNGSLLMGLSLLAAAWLLPVAAPGKEPWKLVIGIHVGTVLTWVTLVYGAATGMAGEQIVDPRWDAQAMVVLRLVGYAVLLVCLVELSRRVLRFRRAPEDEAS